MENTKVIQTKNENGTFTYSIDGIIIIKKESKKEYTLSVICFDSDFGRDSALVFTTSLKTANNQCNYWTKYGAKSLSNFRVVTIDK